MNNINLKNSLKSLIIILLLGVIVFIYISYSDKPSEPKKIGILMSSDFRILKAEGVKEGLKRYGFIEGENVIYMTHNADGNRDKIPQFANELVNKGVDVLVVTGESEALAAKEATINTNIPIVFVGVGIAKDIGLVDSYDHPGQNITGVDNYYLRLSGKRLEYFQRLIPGIREVAVFYDPRVTPSTPTLKYLDEVSRQLDIQVDPIPIQSRREAIDAFTFLDRQKVDGVMLLCSSLMESITDDIVPIALEIKIPIMGVSEKQTQDGTLASYGMPYEQQGIQASRLVAKVLRGHDPGTIPVEAPSKVEFIINLNTAKKMGLALDPEGLIFATKIIN